MHSGKIRRIAAALLCAAMALDTAAFTPAMAAEARIMGDLNGDGVVNGFDAAIYRTILNTGDERPVEANVNGDHIADEADLGLMQAFLLGEDVHFTQPKPIEPEVDFITRCYAVDAAYRQAWKEDTNAGFAGEAYVNYDNLIGSYIEWTVEIPEDGNYTLDFHYANGTAANRRVKVIVNGDRAFGTYVDFPGTGAWTDWGDSTMVASLHKGYNTIKAYAVTENGGPNMDYLELTRTTDDAVAELATGGRRMEALNRGLSAAQTGNGMLLSWRLLANDNENTLFKVFKNGSLLCSKTWKEASNYFDQGGTPADVYTIEAYVDNQQTGETEGAVVYGTSNAKTSGAYFDIQTNTPPGGKTPDGVEYTYTENDCSVGDVDGDGEYEIFVKWDPSNSHDNADAGYTGPVIIDCYKLDGTQLWRINLGINVRAGAHYTQFMVYDFDGDGRAEMICKTADGTTDGAGKVIGDAAADYRDATQMKLRDGSYAPSGRIISGPEYLTLFDGATGAALDTVDFEPARGAVSDWGDTWGNRCDRMTACVAYLDGVNPSACFGRGYYEQMAMSAWDVKDKKLAKRWVWSTGTNSATPGYGDGNHHCMAADCDGDGDQEIVCGSAILDDGGVLYSTTGLAHGDAIHVGDFDPANPGLEIFQCLEDKNHPNGNAVNYGVILRSAKDNTVLFREEAGGDTGRCICDNLIAGNEGAEMAGSHSGNLYAAFGDHGVVAQWSDITKWGQNSVVYWTDVLERAVLDRTMLDQYGKGRVFTGEGVEYNNYSKANACLTCDLTGDWREEMIFRKSGGGLRVYTTTYSSEYAVYSLMHNPQYRAQVASQNNGYNQPPHTDYFLGTDYPLPEAPDVWTE